MAMGLQYYPPSIENPPKWLTRPTFLHRFYCLLSLFSLLLYLVFYLALTAAAGYVVYLAVQVCLYHPANPVDDDFRLIFLKVGVLAAAVMLFLFLAKGIFHVRRPEEPDFLEIVEAEQPEFFAFVRRLCREVRAPFPHRIYLCGGMEAAVFQDTSLLNLFVPVRKNLVIGLALVNTLTLDELKAVLAHEFGHFSQAGMVFGTYVWTANEALYALVFGRDRWDDWMDSWRRAHIRVGLFAYPALGAAWVLRRLLTGAFFLINLPHLALRRQAEFHADLVAASVTGSDSITHALHKLPFGRQCLNGALQTLATAARQNIFSRDVYAHQLRAGERLRARADKPSLGEPPPLPEDPGEQTAVFPPLEFGGSKLWWSHPSEYDRERNVKRRYTRSVVDPRSPWCLFRDAEGLRAAATAHVYQTHLHVTVIGQLSDPDVLEPPVEAEPASPYDPRYQGMFDRRYLQFGDLEAALAAAAAPTWTVRRMAQVFERVYSGGNKEWLAAHRQREKDRGLLKGLEGGWLQLKTRGFDFRGRQYRREDIPSLRRMVEKELEEGEQAFVKFDQELLQAHVLMARAVSGLADGPVEIDLLARYRFLAALQEIEREAKEGRVRLGMLVIRLRSAGQLTEEQVRKAVVDFRNLHAILIRAACRAESMPVLTLPSVNGNLPFSHSLGLVRVVGDLYSDSRLPEPGWITDLGRQLEAVGSRAGALEWKTSKRS